MDPPIDFDLDSAEMHDDENGDLVVGIGDILMDPNGAQYRILSSLGNGMYGTVYKVERVDVGGYPLPVYALKITKSIQVYRRQAQMEISLLSFIRENATFEESETLVLFESSFDFMGHLCIVQELLGINTFEVISRRSYRGLPIKTVQTVAKQLLIALVALKRLNIVHTDIKPENILIKSDDGQVKLIDFGSAHILPSVFTYYIQSRFYRAPEVVLEASHEYSIDMWSLGCVLFELFVGLPLFPCQTEPHLIHLIVEMLGKIPDSLLAISRRKSVFFNEAGELKSEAQICAETGINVSDHTSYFQYDNMKDIVMNYALGLSDFDSVQNRIEKRKRALFLDFLHETLAIDPRERITPEDALNLPFITTDFSS